MPFLIETYDSPERAHIRQQFYSEHLDFLRENSELLLACGAKLDDVEEQADGGIYLVDLETRKNAESFIARDPFYQNNLFRRIVVQRWRKAYFNGTTYLS